MAKGKRRRSNRTETVSVAPSDQRETVSISKIENGFLIEKSGVKRGKWYSKKEFSAGKPSVVASVPSEAKATKSRSTTNHKGPVPLREVGYLNRSR